MINKDFYTYTKLVGVTHKNDAGINIQEILPVLSKGGRLYFIRDYSNQYDKNAIKAFYFNKDVSIHIGYLNQSLAAEIAPFLDNNPSFDLEGIVEQIVGGEDKTYGCNVRIWIQNPDEPSYEEIKAFQNQYASSQDIFSTTEDATKSFENSTKNPLFTFLKILIPIFAIIIIVTLVLSSPEPANSSEKDVISDTLITLNEYKRLKTGMSRTDVYYVVGSFGDKISESGKATDDYHIEIYSYEGYGEVGANAQLMFTNGELESMSQFGLNEYDNAWDIETVENNISINDFEFSYNLAPKNILGYYDIEVICDNKSQYNIISLIMHAKINGSSEEVSIFCSDIIPAGTTSEPFTSLGTNKVPINDYEILDFSILIKSENGNFYYFEYDYKTKQSKIF